MKYRKPPSLGHVFVFTLVFFIISTFLSIWVINKGIEPTLMDIAETRTRQFTRLAINEAVSKKIAEDLHYEQLIQEETDNEGKVVSVGWNSVVTNRVVRNTTFRVQNFLRQLENGEIPEPGSTLDVELEPETNSSIDSVRNNPTLIEIPVGQAFGIPLLANLGPKIPVQIEVIGDVQSEPIMKHKELGINNVFFELFVHLEVNLRIVVPFQTRPTTITQDIKIDDRYLPGEVPEFYNNGGASDTPFSIPIDPLQ
ncbi:sporulation protein YunB [Sediminibacillus massiliensis]|uniref:sporulation protein YunB n=1 Tax=Sediminibacillus massiliensis TaxID=1926277 RepID=UPI00098864D2|nr:sporulation protein YunB [Sediminibacillus massiliensis]